jgi:TolA-binding protein
LRPNFPFGYFWAFIGALLIYSSCITPKDTAASRGMQNLTAKYNIIYNANIILDESQRNIEKAYLDDYGQTLPLYKEPSEAVSASETGNLDSVINKANTIVNDKLNSRYVDDAYLLVAKSNYLKSQFFNASEYFSYLIKNYPEERDVRQEARAWRIRALLQLDDTAEASDVLDSALKYLETSKKVQSQVYASQTQYLIEKGQHLAAIQSLKNAIATSKSKSEKIRWKFILGQLQANSRQYQDAYKNFTAVVKSNAPFDMAFNANLNRIEIEEEQSGKKSDRITRLVSLLKDDKNKDFTDQIYYQIGSN